VDTNELKRKIKARCPQGILDVHSFGREGVVSMWVESGSLTQIASAIAEDPGIRIDWLENLSCFEMSGTLVLSYFLRSPALNARLVLRVSYELPDGEKEVVAPSVVGVWPMASPFEKEIADLFGVRFGDTSPQGSKRFLLPDGWEGYPLRKAYIFPTEFLNIPHLRPAGHSVPDEFGVIP